MGRTVSIGKQWYADMIEEDLFFVDKTDFIREWWYNNDDVTLITRPRRFGKTLNMSMLESFFSLKYKDRSDLFEGLSVWNNEELRTLQGSFPVVFLTFSEVKMDDLEGVKYGMCECVARLYGQFRYLMDGDFLDDFEKKQFASVRSGEQQSFSSSLARLSEYLYHYHNKKCIILLDEYDVPMQQAWLNGFWDEAVSFMRSFMNATFKANPCLERAVITGVTGISKESIFSDLNNLEVVSTSSDKYETCFGFTEEEVFAAMDEMGLTNKDEVKEWYDGFNFGNTEDIYNPWSITNFLDSGIIKPYWANSSSNALAGDLIRRGSVRLKNIFDDLLQGKTYRCTLDEEIVFKDLNHNEDAVWSLLVASGYMKISARTFADDNKATISLTNKESRVAFERLISKWFRAPGSSYNEFIDALLKGDLDAMNAYMNDVAMATFSYFDTGEPGSEKNLPERFYHGFVLGLMVELKGRYILTSNRESGFGRYDICLEPKDRTSDDAILIEFKVYNPKKGEQSLDDTVKSALDQIREKKYAADLVTKGIPEERIRSYGFAFEGKTVLIGKG